MKKREVPLKTKVKIEFEVELIKIFAEVDKKELPDETIISEAAKTCCSKGIQIHFVEIVMSKLYPDINEEKLNFLVRNAYYDKGKKSSRALF